MTTKESETNIPDDTLITQKLLDEHGFLRIKFGEFTENFTFSIYLRGLREFIEESGEFGLLAKFEEVTITCEKTTRKFIITIRDDNSAISFICNEDDNPRTRIKDFNGTLKQISNLVSNTIILIGKSKYTFFETFKVHDYKLLYKK